MIILEKDKIKITRLERYLEELKSSSNQERIINVTKAINYYKGDRAQIFDPTIIEDIVRN